MCGRYTLTYADLGEVADLLGAIATPPALALDLHLPRFNVAPTNACVIALATADTEARPTLVPALWGVRHGGRVIINLRGETAAARLPEAFANGRCVVPADGFFEWHGERADRRPVWFHAPDGSPLLMAALLERERTAPPAFAILTGPARPPVSAVHDRMPVLLTPESARRWLHHAPTQVRADDVALIATDVSPRVNAVAHDDPTCIAPFTEPTRQLDLFSGIPSGARTG